MRALLVPMVTLLFAAGCQRAGAKDPPVKEVSSVHELTVNTIEGKPRKLSDFRGKTLLIVNTASKCGYTPQYKGLQTLYERYRDRGFEVLAFPSNDFGGQEPGSSEEIRTFCEERYEVTFPLFEKVHAKGDDIAPLYRYLTRGADKGVAGEVRWNFTKFLIDPAGKPVARFEPAVEPLSDEIVSAVERALPPKPAPKKK